MTTINIRPIAKRVSVDGNIAKLYTCPTKQTVIDKFTITNSTASAITVNVLLVNNLDTEDINRNCVIKSRSIAPSETYVCPEVVGQVLETGDRVSVFTSGGNVIVSATGRELS